jgi:hypothetical protein
VAHTRERERIELRAGEQLLAVRLGKGAEHAAAGRIDQHLDLGLLLLEQGLIGVDAAQIREIERDRTDGVRALVVQLLQPLFSAGNDPDLVIACVLVHRVDELPADTGGCTGDDSNVHTFSSKTKKSVVLSYRICSGCARDVGIKNRCERYNVRSDMVGVARLELAASWSRTMRATICATPRCSFFIIMITHTVVKYLFSFFAEKYAKFVGSCFRKKCIFLLFFS